MKEDPSATPQGDVAILLCLTLLFAFGSRDTAHSHRKKTILMIEDLIAFDVKDHGILLNFDAYLIEFAFYSPHALE